MQTLNENTTKAIVLLAQKLAGKQYCVRGTTSLVLQGLDMGVQDVDVLCNSETATIANEYLKEYLVDSISYKESDKFKSYFGKFIIEGIDVEFMGDWQIKKKDGTWSEKFDGSKFNTVKLKNVEVKTSKIEDELEIFLLMGRFTAYQKIKRQLTHQPDQAPETSAQKVLFN